MATLYVDRKELELKPDGHALAIYEKGQRQGTIPLALLERVVISAPTRLTSGLLAWLTRHRVSVSIIGPRDVATAVCMLGSPAGDAARRIAQYCAYCDEQWRRGWSLRLLRAKFAAQVRTLRFIARERPDERKVLLEALELILRSSREAAAATSPAVLMGTEGAVASAYFRALSAVFPPALGFVRRNRRPPRDPVNACLSLAYTLAYTEAVREIHAAGLDPFVGFYHELAWNRASLACDLVEPLRPRLDLLVWRLFRERLLRAEHFRHLQGACLLGKAGRRAFYEAYERVASGLRRRLRRGLRLVVRALQSHMPQAREVIQDEEPLH